MNIFFWILVLKYSYNSVQSVGCVTDNQMLDDEIDLSLDDSDTPQDGQEVPLFMSVITNQTGQFVVVKRVQSQSSSHQSIIKVSQTGPLRTQEAQNKTGSSDSEEYISLTNRPVNKFKQVWKNVEVFGYGATYDSKTRELIIGKFAGCIFLDLKSSTPRLDIKEAAAIVRSHLRREFIPIVNKRNSKLYIYINPTNRKAQLAWFLTGTVSTHDKKSFSNVQAFVCALTGKILALNERLETYLMTGDGGNIKVGQHLYGEGDYKSRHLDVTGCTMCPKCVASNRFVEIYNANHSHYYIEPQRCFTLNRPHEEECDPQSPSSDATNKSYSQVHDALYYVTAFRQMMRDVFKDMTLDKCSESGKIKVCVHYDQRNWASFQDNGHCNIYFGYGYKGFLDPVAPSTLAHELGHAIIKVTSNLLYSCQSGGIIEAFADICGLMFKAYLNNMEADWGIGSEIIENYNTMTAVRYMDDPPRNNHSIDCTADYPYRIKCDAPLLQDPHRIAGVYSKAFYNLVNTDNWDLITAFEIFLRATKFYWQANDGFDDALCGLIEATVDVFADRGTQEAHKRALDVSLAFAKVGVICGVTKGTRRTTTKKKGGKSSSKIRVKHKPGCPPGWLTFTSFRDRDEVKITSCFKIVNEVSTWAEASVFCESISGHLMMVENRDKLQWISDQLEPGTEYWIGGRDMEREGHWKWTKPFDVPIIETYWRNNEPTSTPEQNCLAMARHNVRIQKFGWSDEDCADSKPFICEMSCCGLRCRSDT